ncbi:proline--tRNA ligase [Malassezia psittaci]|uniref:proline--tRNA ligase n=1 Tax=Malassezia psittaci TaxID=1821823 RepID=A0AAF0FB80_9BASI|nr:proline--tRNA ligase [Malassezia psittaci]
MHARSLFFRHGSVDVQINGIGPRNPARCHIRDFTVASRKEAPRPVRLSSWYSPTLSSDDVASIDTIDSMKILLRGGYVRQSASGTYTYLANGLRILNKITAIIDEEMSAIGASRIEMPQLLQSKLWHKTGRVEAMGSELFRFKDRRGSEMILAPTHEEEVTKLVGSDVDSHKALPVRVYQIGRKFRDEPRPRAGLLRTKEFLMKDMYSFDSSTELGKQAYADVRQAYANIFNRIFNWDAGLFESTLHKPAWREAEADTGAMGGKLSHEFHVEDPVGEDQLLSCDHCNYAANTECAVSSEADEMVASSPQDLQVKLFESHSSEESSLVALVYPKRSELNPVALQKYHLKSIEEDHSTRSLRIVQDTAVKMDATLLLEFVKQSFPRTTFTFDESSESHTQEMIRVAKDGDLCAHCNTGHLHQRNAIEIGHTFLLGKRYSEALGYYVVPPGQRHREPLQMGCYGIGVTRIMGALAQRALDYFLRLNTQSTSGRSAKAGFVWPSAVAPFQALVLPSKPLTADKLEAAMNLCNLLASGTLPDWRGNPSADLHKIHIPMTEIALDDRPERTLGSSLFDAELTGYPFIFILGKHWEKTGEVEVRRIGYPTCYATFEGVHSIEKS